MAVTITPTRERVPDDQPPAKAWRMLALGVSAQAAGSLFLSTPAYLIPLLHLDRGVPLAQAGLLAAAPCLGMVLGAGRLGRGGRPVRGAVGDRGRPRAHRRVRVRGRLRGWGYVGLGVLFVLGGAAAASTSAASGRVVMGLFPRSRRGLAMGIRQVSQPLGVAVAALAVPTLAGPLRHLGAAAAGGRAHRRPRRRLRGRHRQPAPAGRAARR